MKRRSKNQRLKRTSIFAKYANAMVNMFTRVQIPGK
jgi:hypothetical protein